jgi:hypothetical protein
MLARQRGRPSQADRLLELERLILADCERPSSGRLPESLVARGARWYDDIVVPVLLALTGDARETFILNVVNRGTLAWIMTSRLSSRRRICGQ